MGYYMGGCHSQTFRELIERYAQKHGYKVVTTDSGAATGCPICPTWLVCPTIRVRRKRNQVVVEVVPFSSSDRVLARARLVR